MSLLEKLREPRLGGFVIFDYAATLGATYFLANYTNTNFLFVFVILLIISIIAHSLLKIPTYTNYLLGLSKNPILEINSVQQN